MGRSIDISFISHHRSGYCVAVLFGVLLWAGVLCAQSEAAPSQISGAPVLKASPTLSITSPASLIASEQSMVQAILAGSDLATGTITFSVYGSDDQTCSGEPLAALPPFSINGDGTYDQLILPPEAGQFPLIARYSGDENNEAAANACGDPGSVLNVIDPIDPDGCGARLLEINASAFPRPRPFGRSEQVPGVRVQLRAEQAIARVKPIMIYRIGGQRKSPALKTRTFRLDPEKRVRFRAPNAVIRNFKRADESPRQAPVKLRFKVQLRSLGTPARCFGGVLTRQISTRLSSVSGRVALRRLGPTA